MNFLRAGRKVTFQFENPKFEQPNLGTLVVPNGAEISESDLDRLLVALCKRVSGLRPKSQKRTHHEFLRPLFAFMAASKCGWPKRSDDWQMFLLNFQRYYLTNRTFSTASAVTRVGQWRKQCAPCMSFLQQEELIPGDVVIPSTDQRHEQTDARDEPLLGRPEPKIPQVATVQKLLLDLSYVKADSDYLSDIERDLRSRVELLKRVCLTHWDAMKADHSRGRELAAAISEEELRRELALPRQKYGPRLAAATTEFGLEWGLAATKYLLQHGRDVDCIAISTLRTTSLFGHWDVQAKVYRPRLLKETQMPKAAFKQLRSSWMFYRFAGVLSGLDMAVACALLQIEHPNFSPESISELRLLNVRGKHYLIATDVDGVLLFSADKPRARKRITTVLSPLAKEIVEYVLRITAPVRRVLKGKGDRGWRFLFLGMQKNGVIGPPRVHLSVYLTRDNQYFSLTRLYPDLSSGGLARGTLDYRRIRNTQGVLRWFETGSVAEVARTLGNTSRVTLQHYLPPALLHAWNVRLVRYFQQVLVVLASEGETYQLDVSDFYKLDDLLKFIADLVLAYPADKSPVGDAIHKLFASAASSTTKDTHCDAILHIRVSPESLALLHAFSEWASRLDEKVRLYKSPRTGLMPQQFIDMSRMLTHACNDDDHKARISEMIDLPLLKRCNSAAARHYERYRRQFSAFTLEKKWATA